MFFLRSAPSGIPDAAVGSHYDNDSKTGSGIRRGSVYILFLNRNGTVKAEQKISDTQGGLVTALDEQDYFGYSVSALGDLDNE